MKCIFFYPIRKHEIHAKAQTSITIQGTDKENITPPKDNFEDTEDGGQEDKDTTDVESDVSWRRITREFLPSKQSFNGSSDCHETKCFPPLLAFSLPAEDMQMGIGMFESSHALRMTYSFANFFCSYIQTFSSCSAMSVLLSFPTHRTTSLRTR